MKKLILSAVFAFACFTAQAKNKVVSSDDKNPKSKAKVVIITEILPIGCTVDGSVSGMCGDEFVTSGTVVWASNCTLAYVILGMKKFIMGMNLCN